ncbi:hypothetical protein AMELA_G00121660 [Ameiurus melas]|uniref:Uncharacterized protein n=1 Tax=Ameiurus melas TaxID=219545 RepID=A0A7J6ALQ8_AMEME|nr:hypothetical protein AMELA_G00121660 [Ameiurus melas]
MISFLISHTTVIIKQRKRPDCYPTVTGYINRSLRHRIQDWCFAARKVVSYPIGFRTYPHYPNMAEWVENVQLSDTISQIIKILEVYKLQSRPIKIALSAVTFAKMRLGDKESQVCAVIGPAVEEIRSTEALLDHGNFILCPVRCRKEQQSVSVAFQHFHPCDKYLKTGNGQPCQTYALPPSCL